MSNELEPVYNNLLNLTDSRLRAATTKVEKKELVECVAEKAKQGRKVLKTIQSIAGKLKEQGCSTRAN